MNAAENLFNGFEDLGDDFATVEVNNEAPKTLEEVSMGARPNSWKEPKLYREKCPKCAGTGLYRGPSSYGRACFACGGVMPSSSTLCSSVLLCGTVMTFSAAL